MTLVFNNPLWPHYFADPFVLRWAGNYFAYGTGEGPYRARDGRTYAFQILRSKDLVRWESAGGALELDGKEAAQDFWAPEVAADGSGEFLLYYSSAPRARDEFHRVRVAVGKTPTGPFTAQGTVLPETEGFSIDGHPFRDPQDGHRYLFFAKDFFEGRTGTGLAVVPLSGNLRRAAGISSVVIRANADWQIYERDRSHYGRQWTAWHTVEAPCVVFHRGRYYCFYSGGNWQTHEYGVSYAVADHPLGPWQHDDSAGPVVLKQVPGAVLGPGHNCHVLAPDGETELLVYHAWDPAGSARRMCMDRLIWSRDGPRCLGPTVGPQQL